MENNQDKWSGEMIISPNKIWHNAKKYWWIALFILGPIIAYIGLTGIRNYRGDQARLTTDTYQSTGTVFIDSRDEDYSDSYKWILYSDDLRAELNEMLEAQGYEPYNKNTEAVYITRMGESMYYEVLVRGFGEKRVEVMAEAYAELLISYAKEIMHLKGQIINPPTLVQYVELHDGSFLTFDLDQTKNVGLSLRTFVTWSKLMILCAGVFLWVAIIMVFVFMDKVLHTKRETDIATGMNCLCTIDKKNVNALDLLAVMLDFTGKNSGKNHFVLVSAEKNEALSSIAAGLHTNKASVQAEAVTDVITEANALETCGNADYVVLTVTLNQDKVPQVEQAVRNLKTVGANVLGYVLVK